MKPGTKAKRPYRTPQQMDDLRTAICDALSNTGDLKPLAIDLKGDGLDYKQRYDYFLSIAHRLGWRKYFLLPHEWAEVKQLRRERRAA